VDACPNDGPGPGGLDATGCPIASVPTWWELVRGFSQRFLRLELLMSR
jgi:hypothetical protein